MTEERKHAILFAATLLCARKMIETMESDKPNFAKQYFVDKVIDEAGLFWSGLIGSGLNRQCLCFDGMDFLRN